MTTWEYKVELLGDPGRNPKPVDARLAEAGAEGWELVSVVQSDVGNLHAIYKRPLVEEEIRQGRIITRREAITGRRMPEPKPAVRVGRSR